MQHLMMGAAKTKLEEYFIRVANEIAISEKQKFDDVPDRLRRCRPAARAFGHTGCRAGFAGNYVSHVDIFCFYVTKPRRYTKGSCCSAPTLNPVSGSRSAGHSYRVLQGEAKYGMGAENAPSRHAPRTAKEEIMAAQSYDRLEGVIWYDGKLVSWNEANVHVLTHGLHYASCVFEGERAYGGQIFKSTEHSERLKRSANILDFDIPYSVAEIDAAKKLVVDRNGRKEAYVRPIAWRGSEMMGVSAQSNTIHFAIASWEWPSYFDPEQRLKGIRLDLADYRRPDPKTAPCLAKAAGLYMICTISKHKAERKGYADAMMLDWEGRVAECTGANIFFIKDGKIHTPIADCFLDGITRQTVIGLARKRGIEVIERRIMPNELTGFWECFITGSAAEVTAVAEIADWNFNPGGITKTLMDDYTAEVKPKAAAA